MAINMNKDKLKKALPYTGLPILAGALFTMDYGEVSGFVFLQSVLLIVFGYAAAVSDLRTRRVSNGLILTMVGTWVITMAPYLFWDTGAAVVLLRDATLGFLVGGLLFMVVYIVSRKGLGLGDVKFIAVAGLYIGFANIIGAMLYGSIFAGLTALVLLLLKKIGRKDAMPLIPFLYIGILLTIFYR